MNQRNQKNSDKSANIGLIRKPDKSDEFGKIRINRSWKIRMMRMNMRMMRITRICDANIQMEC
jgi:hypothetical protein